MGQLMVRSEGVERHATPSPLQGLSNERWSLVSTHRVPQARFRPHHSRPHNARNLLAQAPGSRGYAPSFANHSTHHLNPRVGSVCAFARTPSESVGFPKGRKCDLGERGKGVTRDCGGGQLVFSFSATARRGGQQTADDK